MEPTNKAIFIVTAICVSVSVRSQIAIRSHKLPAPQYSITIHMFPSLAKLPLYPTIYSLLHSFRMLIYMLCVCVYMYA